MSAERHVAVHVEFLLLLSDFDHNPTFCKTSRIKFLENLLRRSQIFQAYLRTVKTISVGTTEGYKRVWHF
jgi:hypothetical protein